MIEDAVIRENRFLTFLLQIILLKDLMIEQRLIQLPVTLDMLLLKSLYLLKLKDKNSKQQLLIERYTKKNSIVLD